MVDLLIKNGLILTMDESLSIIKGSIAVEDGKIRKIGKNFGGQAEEVLDAEGKIVMPGLVLPHCHFQNVLQGLEREEDISPPGWSPLEEFLTKEEILTATTFSCACLLSSGVTFAVNILSLKAISSGLLDEVFTKEEEMGMKGLIAVEIWDDEKVDGSKALREEEKLLRKNDSKRIEPLLSVRAYSSDEILDCVRDLLAERENLRLSVRISKTPAEYYYCRSKTGESPLQRLHRQGLIDGRTVLTHFTYRVEEEDLKIIRRSEAKIVHTPLDYVYTHTFPAVKSVDEMGIKGSVGMDHPFDLFEILRTVYLHQRAIGEHIPASRLLQMVTKEAAELYGIRDIGSIEVGKSADLLIVNLPPLRDESIYEHLLLSLTSQRVETVISSGRILKREGKPCWDELKVNREFARMMSLLRRKIRHGVAGS
jgi:cytosine/adenosine deaminase-related metal-dependent hydrolase